ncbi:MAG TPA: MJ1477/TM1410 family putative glycoside hydrolase, partial [Gammaproteobacteria bacterium]|nr:MJ1477/TM1410 family putative glycoside hydrolase [Gammaproteobacteria bacterium]
MARSGYLGAAGRVVCLALAVVCTSCGSGDISIVPQGGDCTPTSVSIADTQGTPLTGPSFAYQLQNADPTAISGTQFAIIVMDYSRDGSDQGQYTSQQIQALHAAGKKALAYISIGEAESYRYYFLSSWTSGTGSTVHPSTSAPCWLGNVDPAWAGNFAVKYWSEDWQKIILGYVDKVIAQGFDGVYLDKVDEFEYWSAPNNGDSTQLKAGDAAAYMISFVKRIADHARNGKGLAHFLMVPQNGEDLLPFDPDGSYLATMSGMGIEDLFYDGTTPVAASETAYREGLLDQIAGA